MYDHTIRPSENNITTVEFLNSFFIIIILYLHHTMYMIYHIKLLPEYNLNLYLQKMAVGGFLFLSGFKLTHSKIKSSVGAFIKNRFFRIYLPYVLAVICYSGIVFPYINLGRFPNYKNVFIHVLGIQSILPGVFGSQYLTLWFVSFLFLCYAFFLLTRKIVTRSSLFLMSLAFSILIILIIHLYSTSIMGIAIFSKDILIYLIYFAMGMLYAKNRFIMEKTNSIILLVVSIFGLISTLYFYTYKPQVWGDELILAISYIISSIAFYILIFKGFKQYRPSRQIKSLIQNMSFASFFVFLFHRPVWSIMNLVWFDISILHSLYMIVFAPIVIFVGCHRFQSGYNRLLQNME
ncbi:membrane protein containing Acyltransferase 3 domain protein [Candidatus Magnetomorum sp. HK-1]|nr:membrane protein containing Acyltransferase 3 domain protein [Candidatus Magnetomorum sp. HK-1]